MMPTAGELLKKALAKLIKKTFGFWQSAGVHVVPNHYYEPIPDTNLLPDKLWKTHSELPGLNINESRQIELLGEISGRYGREFNAFPKDRTAVDSEYYFDNGSFCGIDAGILHGIVRNSKPNQIFEIGSGFSTFVSAKALLLNEKETGSKCELTAIEPYPNGTLRAGFPGLARLERKLIQDVDSSVFRLLKANDILFIDSSHVLKIGSDVQYEYLEILPRLNKGVLVHCHDIFTPLEYPKEWIFKKRWFWTEQYLLQAFLAFNDSFEVFWAGSYMNLKHPELVRKTFTAHNPADWPCSFWMRKIK
jgi:hypothetical protein